MIILGIDYGTKNIGLAVTDELQITAQPLAIVTNYGMEKAVLEVAALSKVHKAGQLVIGFPMTHPEGEMAKAIKEFSGLLAEATGLPVKLWDESFSSKTIEAGLRGKAVKSSDSLVAASLLREYLDYLREFKL